MTARWLSLSKPPWVYSGRRRRLAIRPVLKPARLRRPEKRACSIFRQRSSTTCRPAARAVAAAAVIVGTVVLSLAASFGLSVLLWQHIVGIPLHWMVLPMSVIVLLAVGADYNLLLVSRMKEEVHAGINTGILRSMVGTGSVVTAAGLVFAFTMMSMAVSKLVIIGQVGTTIGLGLLFDTLVVRSLMTPSIASLLGRWFWWPQRVRPRPVPSPWPTPIEREPQQAVD